MSADTSKSARVKYDLWAEKYDDTMADMKWQGPDLMTQALKQALGDRVNGPLDMLDLGTGTGMLAHKFRQVADQAHITGTDLSENMLKICLEKKRADKVSCVDLNAGALPFDDESFDVTTCCGVLDFVEDLPSLLDEMNRVTKPGGVISFTTRVGYDAAGKLSCAVGDVLQFLRTGGKHKGPNIYLHTREKVEPALKATPEFQKYSVNSFLGFVPVIGKVNKDIYLIQKGPAAPAL